MLTLLLMELRAIAQFVKSVSLLRVRPGCACTQLSSKNIFALRYNRLYAALPTFTQFQDGGGIAEFSQNKNKNYHSVPSVISNP